MRYDTIIVGAGSAGGVLAARLTENPALSVLLLEAGPDFGSTSDEQPAEVLDAADAGPTPYDWGYLGHAWHRPNLEIRANSLADEVLVADGRVVGVRTGTEEIESDRVILSAGAYGSPAILLRSGIDHPGVGQNLYDHPLLRLRFEARGEPAVSPRQTLLTTDDLQIFPESSVRRRRPLRGGRLDHADHPAREHQPPDPHARRPSGPRIELLSPTV